MPSTLPVSAILQRKRSSRIVEESPRALRHHIEILSGSNNSPSPSKGKLRAYPRRWCLWRVTCLCITGRAVWYWSVLHSRVLTRRHDGDDLSFVLAPRNDDETRVQRQIHQRRWRRRELIKPLRDPTDESTWLGHVLSQPDTRIEWKTAENAKPWSELCHSAQLGSDSHLVIVGGGLYKIPLLLQNVCQLQRVTIIDPLFPVMSHRLTVLESAYKPLYQSIPNFRFIAKATDLEGQPSHLILAGSNYSYPESSELSKSDWKLFCHANILSSIQYLIQWHPLNILAVYDQQEMDPIQTLISRSLRALLKVNKLSWNEIIASPTTLSQRHGIEAVLYALVQRSGLHIINLQPLNQSISDMDWDINGFDSIKSTLPCATSCGKRKQCNPSVWDAVIPITRHLTQKCAYVVYWVNFSAKLEQLALVERSSKNICRVAFVSAEAPIVRTATRNVMIGMDQEEASHVEPLNGSIDWNGWTLVWLPVTEESIRNDYDVGLPIIDPVPFFAPSVRKALYIDTPEYIKGGDSLLERILERMDAASLPDRWEKQTVPGTTVSREVFLPARPERTSVLFVGEAQVNFTTPKDFSRLVSALPSTQLRFYESVEAWTYDEDDNRKFPYTWLSLALLGHDLTTSYGSQLRCEWLAEYLYWGDNQHAEELSLAYTLGRWLVRNQATRSEESSWMRLLSAENGDDASNEGRDLFIRILKRRKSN